MRRTFHKDSKYYFEDKSLLYIKEIFKSLLHVPGAVSSVQNPAQQLANAETFAKAYLCFLVSTTAKKVPRQLNS